MQIPFVDLKAQYKEIEQEINHSIKKVLEDTSFIGGAGLSDFEDNFANYIGTKYCTGVGNGTDALFIALKCLGIGKGDEVLTAANSFIATSEAISLTGAKVVFVDCCEKTYNMDLDQLESKISKKTKAILPVHLYGQSIDMDRLLSFAKAHNLMMVEDCAQAHGAEYNNKRVGTFGDAGCFSFYPGKNLGAYGDAGAIVTDSEKLHKRIKMFKNHGRMNKYNHEFEGINSRLDGLQAAVLNEKLKSLDRWNNRRREIADVYTKSLPSAVKTPFVIPGAKHVYHLYVIRSSKRNSLKDFLAENGISTGIHYPIPLPLLKAYEYLDHKPGDFPVANALKDEILSLPIHGSMSEEQVDYVVKKVNEFF